MYRILEARNLAGNIYEMVVEAPRVAKRALPGQFVIVKLNEEAERIPLTICDYDREKGTITIVFQPVGASTSKYVPLKAGDFSWILSVRLGSLLICVQSRWKKSAKKRFCLSQAA